MLQYIYLFCTSGNSEGPNYFLNHMKDEVPDFKLSALVGLLDDSWRRFFLQMLKLRKADIDFCEYQYKSLHDVRFNCLHMWRNTNGSSSTYGALCKLLYDFGYPKQVWGLLESPEWPVLI